MEKLLRELATLTDNPCFGLQAAQFVEPASYSVLGYITMNCSSLREVLAKISIYEQIVGDMGVSTTDIENGSVVQRWDCQFNDPVSRRHEIETVLASWYTYAKNFLQIDLSLEAVWIEHCAPDDPGLLVKYQEFFNCPVLFNQTCSALLIPEQQLDVVIPQADKKLLQTLQSHAVEILAEIDRHQPMAERVKNLLAMTLKEQPPSSVLIAEKLGVSSRTLQRKLDEEGTHFKNLLMEVRLEMAKHYIQNTSLSLERIACLLGYAETRSFYRSFKQWTGHTARSYRQQ